MQFKSYLIKLEKKTDLTQTYEISRHCLSNHKGSGVSSASFPNWIKKQWSEEIFV